MNIEARIELIAKELMRWFLPYVSWLNAGRELQKYYRDAAAKILALEDKYADKQA